MNKLVLSGFLVLCGCVHSSAVGALPVNSYEDCVAQGFKVLRTYPPACIGPEGKIFRSEPKILPEDPVGRGGACQDQCGNGECQEIVCQAIGCPCSESEATCPEDCGKKLP